MRTAVHVQHLPGNLARFGEIDHSACDLLRIGDRAHRRKGLQEILWVVFVKRSVNNSGRDRIEADVLLRIFRGQAAVIASRPPFVIIGRDTGKPPMGLSTNDDGDGRDASARLLSEHLLDRELGDVDVPFKIRRDQGTEIVSAVISEWLCREDACVVDNGIDRAELLNGGCRPPSLR